MHGHDRYLIEIFWSAEDEGFIATVPDLPGCSAWGATPEQALREMQDAKAAWLEARHLAGEPLPEPTTPPHLAAG